MFVIDECPMGGRGERCALARLTRRRSLDTPALPFVDSARWRAAVRNGLAAIMAALLLQAAPALADGAPNLILPLVTAIAFASGVSNLPRQVATLDPGRRPPLGLIPQQVHIVDGYQAPSRTTSGSGGRTTWSTATASPPTTSSASRAAAGR